LDVSEKIEAIRKYREEKETYRKYRPKIMEKFRSLFEQICEELEDLDVEVDEPELAVPAAHYKYRDHTVYPAVLKVGGKPRLCLVYLRDGERRDVVEISKAHIQDVLAVTEVLGDFRRLLEERAIEAMLKKEEEESEKIKEFIESCKIAYEGFSDVLGTLRSLKGKKVQNV